MMREIQVTISCTCGFWVQHAFYTNEYGYFEIPQTYCPVCFHLLNMESRDEPVDVEVNAESKE